MILIQIRKMRMTEDLKHSIRNMNEKDEMALVQQQLQRG
jgi:hypothetical protein